MEDLTRIAKRMAEPLLRISLGVVLLWIGALKFVDPAPVVGLLEASIPFLAFAGFVYVLGVLEVAGGALLFAGKGTQWVSAGLVVLFGGTLMIFLIAPMVSYGEAGFPFLTLAGEFLLKDLVLLAAAVSLIALRGDRMAEGGTPA
jgi:uncharacterized membrane protein YkgB